MWFDPSPTELRVLVAAARPMLVGRPHIVIVRARLARPESRREHSWHCWRTAMGLKYAGAAFITLNSDERKTFLAEVARLTTSWVAFKSSRTTDVKCCQPRLAVRVKHLA